MPLLSTTTPPVDTPFWRIADFGFFHRVTADRHGEFFYPTFADRHPPGYFVFDPLNNALAADMNGDGMQDLVLNPALFPHTVPRGTLLPLLLLADGRGSFSEAPWLKGLPDAGRHMNYRFALDDLNRDGRPDYAAASGGLLERLPDGTIRTSLDAIAVFASGPGGWADVSRTIRGQEHLSGETSPHDLSVGDVNGDGWPDFSAGGRVYLNENGLGFSWSQAPLGDLASYVMTSVIADLDRDGFADLVAWYADGSPVAGAILYGGPDGITAGARIAALPVGPHGRDTKFNHAASADLDGDGDTDVVLGATRADPYYVGREIRILVNEGGLLVDETAARAPADPRASAGPGEGQVFLVDVNADGHVDIVDAGGINYDAAEAHLRILLNDGEGHFTDMPLDVLPYVQPWQVAGQEDLAPFFSRGRSKMVPIDIDGAHGIDFVSMVHNALRAWPQEEPNEITLFSLTSAARWGKAGGGLEGWQVGAPGFDEAYYLRTNPDAAAAVATGAYASAVEHYLVVGRDEGRSGFADGTRAWISPQHLEVRFDGSRAEHAVTIAGPGAVMVVSSAGAVRHDDVGVLRFDDGSLLFDLAGDVAKAAWRLYGGAFDRVPDEEGLRHWAGALASGTGLIDVARQFVAADEFATLHGAPLDDAGFLDVLYRNVLDRPADETGLAHWTRRIEEGASREQVLLDFTQSPEYSEKTSTYVDTGLWVV